MTDLGSNYHKIIKPDKNGLKIATKELSNGGLVVIPTETVYGLGGDATNDDAVARIFAAKARPSYNPLIIHFDKESSVWDHVLCNPIALKLAEKFWPGPLTMVLPKKNSSNISELASAGLSTLAVRVPNHAILLHILDHIDFPLAAPSANRSTYISPTRAKHTVGAFSKWFEIIVDGGPCSVGIESTVVAIDKSQVKILRPGGTTQDQLQSALGEEIICNRKLRLNQSELPSSPGMLSRHYSPKAPISLNIKQAKPDGVLLGFGHNALKDAPNGSLNLSENASLAEAAANLFSMLRELDALNPKRIYVSTIPNFGLGIAINDRLKRAAI